MPKETDTLKQTTQRRQAHQTAAKATRITPMQRELLDMFAHRELSSEEISELKDILSSYFLEKAQDELEALARENTTPPGISAHRVENRQTNEEKYVYLNYPVLVVGRFATP